MTLSWLNPTGGLRYHLRALAYRQRRWRPFTEAVAAWLAGWTPPERDLVLVGPSGGYSLPRAFLARFRSVTAVDPDPLARWIFTLRFGRALRTAGTRLAWDHGDYFSPGPGGFDPAGVRRLLARHPGAAVLFCNFLGQMSLLDPDDRFGDSLSGWQRALPSVLAGRSWASYHDRLSGPLRPRLPAPFAEGEAMDNEQLGEAFYVADEPCGDDAVVEIADHGTGELFPGVRRAYLAWELRPGAFHLIEAVRQVARIAREAGDGTRPADAPAAG